jgi:hypothetical protein
MLLLTIVATLLLARDIVDTATGDDCSNLGATVQGGMPAGYSVTGTIPSCTVGSHTFNVTPND